MKTAGFTLIELVVTIALLAIVAAYAVPRLFQASTFQSRGFYDKATTVVRAAQKTAVAWRRNVFVCVTSGNIKAGTSSGCTPLLRRPTGDFVTEDATSGVTLNTLTFGFDGLGRPVDSTGVPLTAATTITFTSTIAGDPARQITVVAETGHVTAN